VTGKYLGFFRLVGACATARCPVCACLADDSRRAVDAMLGDHVTDPQTRAELYAAWGFCSWHAVSLADGGGATGAAIVFEDLLRRCGERFAVGAPTSPGRRASWRGLLAKLTRRGGQAAPAVVSEYRERRRCRICARLAASERAYIEAIVQFAGDAELTAAYERSAGLCVPHLTAVVAHAPGAPAVSALVETTLHHWQTLRVQLAEFVRKHEYRATEAISPEEAGSYRRAAETLAGLPHLFGNDLPRSRNHT
jgi:hypothetical protein